MCSIENKSRDPNRTTNDIEEYETYKIYNKKPFDLPTNEEVMKLKIVLQKIIEKGSATPLEIKMMLSEINFKKTLKNSFLLRSFYQLCSMGEFNKEEHENKIREILRIKRGKSHSGIISVTVFTNAFPEYTNQNGERVKQQFSCKYNCHFCPDTTNAKFPLPRSYLLMEPGVQRAFQYNFDCVDQLQSRMQSLYDIGHPIDKLEVLVLGGTFSSYPLEYREEFIRDLYYGANTFWDIEKRDRLSLTEEKVINETCKCRIIGLTLETRPDCINPKEIQRYRYYGCTRVQIGVQHLDNDILKTMNRMCKTEHFIRALKMLKNSGYKVDIHIMPNLVGATPEKDRDMLLNRFLGLKSKTIKENNNEIYEYYDLIDEDVQADQWKLYPMEVVPWTEVEKLWREGKYVPYPEEDLLRLLMDTKINVFKWIRVNRIVRDITSVYRLASSDQPHWGQEIPDLLKKEGKTCNCIRCREVKREKWDGQYKIVISHYKSSGGDEYFINAESIDNKGTLYGFIRLRLCNTATDILPELEGCALIRELHVYGQLNIVGDKTITSNTQHKGLGRILLERAENLAKEKGFNKMSIISGNGVKEYYKKFGYINDKGQGDFMIKTLENDIKEIKNYRYNIFEQIIKIFRSFGI